METCSTANNGYNFCIVGDSRSKENHRNKNQNRHKGDDQIDNPKWVKIDDKIRNIETIFMNSRFFCLHINYKYNNHQ